MLVTVLVPMSTKFKPAPEETSAVDPSVVMAIEAADTIASV